MERREPARKMLWARASPKLTLAPLESTKARFSGCRRQVSTNVSGIALSTACLIPAAFAQKNEPNPYLKPNNSWISINGTVTSTTPDTFQLDYGEGLVTVEMDDWDFDADAYKLLPGDQVTVYGLVDDDLYETTSIEASSVYVKGLNTFFYASSADEEDLPATATVAVVDYDVELRGTVESIDGREFTIDSGDREMTVDTIGMVYNPLDDEGFQKIEVGDRVSVTGDIDLNLWEERELAAETIVTLKDASKAKKGKKGKEAKNKKGKDAKKKKSNDQKKKKKEKKSY